jgi:hypothetical protein
MKGFEMPSTSTWFDPYLVLGDDVDISQDSAVATNYQLACADFSIKIGLAKSLHSLSNFFEFANQRLCESGNISPLSFLEEITSQTWNARVIRFKNRETVWASNESASAIETGNLCSSMVSPHT